MMNFIHRFKSLPVKSQRLLSVSIVLGMFVALPLFVWAVVTQTFLINQKAASGEPPTPTPFPTCLPRPACLDTHPACEIAVPIEGWCPTPTPTPTPIAASECQMCGGIAGILCGPNLVCSPNPSYPDQSGICVKSNGTSNCSASPTPTPTATSTPQASPMPGDVNGDGHVNIVDIGIIIDNYRTSPPNDPRADLNHDGIVNIVDIGIVIDHYQP
jgi:hypothetical protein